MANSNKKKAKKLREWYPWLTKQVIKERDLYNFSPIRIFAKRNNLTSEFETAVKAGAKAASK